MEIERAVAGRGRPNPPHETKFSAAKGDRGIFIFPVQLTTRRIGNLTRLIHTLPLFDDHRYIPVLYSTGPLMKKRANRNSRNAEASESM